VTVRGLLLDTGGTLTRPVDGRWNPRRDFEDVLLRHWPDAPVERFAAAFAAGLADPPRELLDDLGSPLDVAVLEPYPEVPAVLDELLSRGLRLAVVTDNWGTAGSVRWLHDQAGLAGRFEAFVVSQEVGCDKPDPRIFGAAADSLGLEPAECLVVDDDPELVAAAIRLGYQGLAVLREGTDVISGVPWARTLTGVLDALGPPPA
jgi:putative hydrolase of the HAD superfamily